VLYNRLFGPVKANQGYVKAEADVDWEQRATMSEQSLRRTKSNIPERRHMYKSSQPSIESKLSLQVPVGRAGRTKSSLRRKQRSRSMDGSIQTRSSEDFSEKTRQTGTYIRVYSLTQIPPRFYTRPFHPFPQLLNQPCESQTVLQRRPNLPMLSNDYLITLQIYRPNSHHLPTNGENKSLSSIAQNYG